MSVAQLPSDFFETWTRGDLVCIDMDSTACVDESINEYAKTLGKLEDIQALIEMKKTS